MKKHFLCHVNLCCHKQFLIFESMFHFVSLSLWVWESLSLTLCIDNTLQMKQITICHHISCCHNKILLGCHNSCCLTHMQCHNNFYHNLITKLVPLQILLHLPQFLPKFHDNSCFTSNSISLPQFCCHK